MIEERQDLDSTAVFTSLESEVRSYCRGWPVVFDRARGSWLYDESDKPYLDFFTGAGTLNYGHNHPALKQPLIDYLMSDRVVHSLDTFTTAKREFLAVFDELVLAPRGLEYRIQFPGPAGTNATEAALKLARKATGRTEVVCFTGGFHGMSVGALAVSANPAARRAAGIPLGHATFVPFDTGLDGAAAFTWFDRLLQARELPAAVILETVQGDGGIHTARVSWLRDLAARCTEHDVPLIVDDVQMGCGRTGPFFSFEAAGIKPDIVCLSKALSGYGLPLALTLIRPELDVWKPGEHTGTFRGFDPAFVTATAALRKWWTDDTLERTTMAREIHIQAALGEIAATASADAQVRGRGMAHALAFADPEVARAVAAAAFERGLLVERAGADDEVVKLLPPLTVSDDELEDGLSRLADAVNAVC